MPRPLRALPALVLTALVGLTGCSGDDGEPEADASQPPARATAPPTPAVGACYALTYEQAVAPTVDSDPVDCAAQHTARTFHVGQLSLVVDGHLLAVDSDKAKAQVTAECRKQFDAYVGGSVDDRRLTMLAVSWFSPTIEQSDAGHAWFRCDVIAAAGPKRLAPLAGDLRGVLGREPWRTRYSRCSTAKPGTPGAVQVICSQKHAWRAIATVGVAANAQGAWPGEASARAAGGACQELARRRAADPLKFEWGWEWPTAEQWQGGQRWGLCWIPG